MMRVVDNAINIIYNKSINKEGRKMPENTVNAVNGPDMGCPEPGRDCKDCKFPCEGV